MALTFTSFDLKTLVAPLSVAALLAVAGPALAQDTTTEAPAADAPAADAPAAEAPASEAPAAAEGTPGAQAPATPELDMGEVADGGNGQPQIETYVDEVFGDWQRECLRIPGDTGPVPCQITQFLREEPEGQPVGKVSLGKLPAGGEAVAGSMVIVPLGVLLTQQMTVGVDSAAPKRYPYRFCDPNGCVAQIGYTNAEIDAFMKGNKATLTVVPTAAPDQQIALPLSLKGFTDAWNSLELPPTGEAAPAAPAAPAQ